MLKKIENIANELAKNGKTMTRSDLAFNLKDFGIKKDSSEINKAVWDCYEKTKNYAVANCFLNNSQTRTLVEEYEIYASLEKNSDKTFSLLDEKAAKTSQAFDLLAVLTSNETKEVILKNASSILSKITGSSALKQCQTESEVIMQKYSEIANSYLNAKDSINSLVSDYSDLRSNIVEIYRKNALILTDIFGDSIKSSMPEIFDFNSIEYLDISSMQKTVELEYDDFKTKCAALIENADSDFAKALSPLGLGKSVDGTTKLLLATWGVVSHHLGMAEKATRMKSELMSLKTSVSKDVSSIRADEMRLLEIYKTVNDIFIPNAQIFKKNSPQIFNEETQKLIENIYSSEDAKKLKEKRDKILDELHDLEFSISDEQENINFYQKEIAEMTELISDLKETYEEAKYAKPERPSGLANLFTLGTASRKYESEIYKWNNEYGEVIKNYENSKTTIHIYKSDLQEQEKLLREQTELYKKLKRDLNANSKEIMSKLSVSSEVKTAVAKNLSDIIKLLKIAKEIASSKLDDRLLNVQKIAEFESIELSDDVKNAISKIKESVSPAIKESVKDFVREDFDDENEGEKVAEEIYQKGLSLCEQLMQLEKQSLNFDKMNEHYKSELDNLQNQFKENLKKIDNKVESLNEIYKKINLSKDNEELKKSLFELLSSDKESFTEKDFDDFLNGNKIIEI